MDRRSLHFKNKPAQKTIEEIKEILNQLKISVTETPVEKSSAGTYSLRLYIDNSRIGSNGKGMTVDLARASAYAELLERLQNRWPERQALSPKDLSLGSHNIAYDEQILSSDYLASQDNHPFLSIIYSACDSQMYESKEKCLQAISIYEREITGSEELIALPFYDLNSETICDMPYYLYSPLYGSNGMCAGNTIHEALIQGISEILERYVQRKVIENAIALPILEEKDLESYPEIWSRLQSLRQIPEYRVELLDATLGGKFPVAALAVIEKNTGRYGIKFGAHPDLGIAFERTLTEACQGLDLKEYCKKSLFSFQNDIVFEENNISNTFRNGRGQYPYQLFGSSGPSCLSLMRDKRFDSDEELLDYLINEVISSDQHILIRDTSYTGFPTFHVVIPGMSEMHRPSLNRYRNLALQWRIRPLLNRPSYISRENSKYIRFIADINATDDMSSSLRTISGALWNDIQQIQGETFGMGSRFLSAMTLVAEGNYREAAQRINIILRAAALSGSTETTLLRAIYYYLTGMSVLAKHDQVIEHLMRLFDEEIIKELHRLFAKPEIILDKIYGNHTEQGIDGTYHFVHSDYPVYLDLMRKIFAAEKEAKIDQKKSFQNLPKRHNAHRVAVS